MVSELLLIPASLERASSQFLTTSCKAQSFHGSLKMEGIRRYMP